MTSVPSNETAKAADPFDESALDGHTVEELGDYLDSGRTPVNFSIESSPGCQIALAALERLRAFTQSLLDAEAANEPDPSDDWISGILGRIALEAHAGRDIPVPYAEASARLSLTEGALRGLIRSAGDSVDGAIVGRCRIDGDVTVIGAPIAIGIDLSIRRGERMPETTRLVREEIYRRLAEHTDLLVTAVDITVRDVRHSAGPAARDGQEATS